MALSGVVGFLLRLTRGMPMLNWILAWLIAGAVMWLVAYQMAPTGRDVPLSHGLIAVIVMGLCGAAAMFYLRPAMGQWYVLAEFLAHGVVVKAMFQLSFGRSLVVVTVYWVVMLVAGIALAMAKGGRVVIW